MIVQTPDHLQKGGFFFALFGGIMTNNLSEIKQSLLAQIDKRVEDKIIETTNAEILKKLINRAEDETEAISIATLGTTYKRTGFHFDPRLEKLDNTIKYFKKNRELSFQTAPDAITHKLIIGDNYQALQNLLIEYKNKIDVIYIDPPYGKDSMGEFAQTNYDNAITRDNLLSMLYPRLVLAKQLLSDEGAIFCSIDDRNQAYVKCLFDEVFEENNFIGTLPRITKKSGKDHGIGIAKNHDYILVYAKDKQLSTFKGLDTNDENYNLKDEYYETRGAYKLNQTLDYDSLWYNETMDFPLEFNNNTYYPGGSEKLYRERHRGIHKPKDWVWRWSKDKFNFGLDNGFVVIKQGKDRERIYTKTYLNATISKNKPYSIEYLDRKTLLSSITLTDNLYSNDNGEKEISKLGLNFDFPKPPALVLQLLKIIQNKSALIMDFFAGSGTTGQAVLELNKEDGGTRQFILVQMNEKTETTPNGIVYDVTSKRLKRVMTGKCYDGYSSFDWIKKNEPLGGNLDVYDIESIANNSSLKGQTAFDVIDETLYGKGKFTSVKEKIEWVIDNFEHTQKYLDGED